jgi:molybdate transport system substrate-binding protein
MKRLLLFLLMIFVLVPEVWGAEPVRVMVAANFRDCLHQLADRYTADTGQEVLISSGATGTLFAQITAGAPCHLFFAADAERPRRLVAAGLATDENRATYAIGRLVLWAPQAEAGTADLRTALTAIDSDSRRRLALANPLHAPYGVAARQALRAVGRWQDLEPRLVLGQSVGQAWQFVHTGAADLGFVSLAQVRTAERQGSAADLGLVLVVPATLHEPIIQQVVLMSDAPASAARFYDYLGSAEVREILPSYGYEVPAK